MTIETTAGGQHKRGLSGLQIFLIVLVTILVTAAVTFWILRTYIFPAEFKPVSLNTKEEQVLNAKLERLDSLQAGPRGRSATRARRSQDGSVEPRPEMLEPEAYSEAGANRSIALSERELNALLARNTDLARKLAIDLSEGLVSAKLLMPVDEDFPFLGGKTLKVRAGLELAYREEKPIVVLKGISVMGVPIPNAWLGGIKNIDLIEQYGADAGFWKSFSDGVENIRITDGNLLIELRE